MRAQLRSVGVLVLVGAFAAPLEARSLKDQLPQAAREVGIDPGPAFDALADALADTAARNIPVIAASAGYTYRYNPELEVFERSSQTLGPIFMERPDTLGRGKFNVNVSYQHVNFDQLDGEDTDDLNEGDPIIIRSAGATGARLTADDLTYDFSLTNNIVALSFTYGVLDNLDVNLLLPLIATDFDVKATRQQVAVADPPGSPFVPAPGPAREGTSDGDRFGVGDLLLRAKYRLPNWAWLRSAAGLTLRLPSGDEDDFQGTGTFEVEPYLTASALFWDRVEPLAQVGLDLRTDEVAQSSVFYNLGVDVDLHPRVSLALAFLGRSEFERSTPAGSTSFLYLTPSGPAERPLLGVDFDRNNFYDFSFGVRGVVWRQVMVFVNGIYALNDDGLRSGGIIPTVGVEGTF